MPEFRCYCLSPDGKILSGEHFEEVDVEAAVGAADALFGERLAGRYNAIEVWQRARKLYPPDAS